MPTRYGCSASPPPNKPGNTETIVTPSASRGTPLVRRETTASPAPAGLFIAPFREDHQMNPITQESLELLKGALAKPNDTLAKSISTATGLIAYDLQAPAK